MMATSKNSAYSLNNHDIITLNIGGCIYSTKRSTLLNNVDKQTYLDLLIRNNNQTEYFIDRDGKYFNYIINSFREKKIILPDKFDELKQLLIEVKFYQIDRLINEIENRLNQTNEKSQQFQITLISNLHGNQRLIKLIGPLKLLTLFPIEIIGKKFLNIISTYMKLENIFCQLIFPFEERSISCQPFDQLQRFVLAKQAKKMGLIVSYCEDYFYIPITKEIYSKEDFSKILIEKYCGKKIDSNIIHHDAYNLVETWLLSNQSDDIYSNASITSVH